MNYSGVRTTAIKSVTSATAILAGWDVAYSNVDFDPTAKTKWIDLSVKLGEAVPITLGASGEDEIRGYIQLNIKVKPNTGDGETIDLASNLRSRFRPGFSFTTTGTTITILRNDLKPGYLSGNWYTTPLLVHFYSRIPRIPPTP